MAMVPVVVIGPPVSGALVPMLVTPAPVEAPRGSQTPPTASYTSNDFASVSNTISPLAGDAMARRSAADSRGASNPLVVLVTSRAAVAFGGSTPMPTDPVVNTAFEPSSVNGLAPAGPWGPAAPLAPMAPGRPCDPVAPGAPAEPAGPTAPSWAITL